jgi:DNA-binding transcriptional MerR regulator
MDVKYLTTAEVAERFRTKPATVRWWRYAGYGPKSIKAGRRRLYAVTEVEAFEAKLRAEAELEAA